MRGLISNLVNPKNLTKILLQDKNYTEKNVDNICIFVNKSVYLSLILVEKNV
jgi:hypothetical protein